METVLFTDVQLFLADLGLGRQICCLGVAFPSVAFRKTDLSLGMGGLDVLLLLLCRLAVLVRRGEKTEGDRDARVKVQIDDLGARALLECLSTRRKESQEGSRLLDKKKERKRALCTLLDSVFFSRNGQRGGGGGGEGRCEVGRGRGREMYG